jgi:hypothetical protein
MKLLICVFCSMLLIALAILLTGALADAQTCTHYASPTGVGNGSSDSQPFKIASFWSVARPGHTLCLLDGQYTGSASMINPPQNLSGTASGRITVKALNDGKVWINGQGSNIPVRLSYNHYFLIEGINASNSVSTVVSITHSDHNIVRRVAAWDAADGNYSIFGIHNNANYNLLEDVAGWGIARKIYQSSYSGNYTTIRRAWGRWEGSHVVGPKMTYTLAYNNYNMVVENAIGTWSGERMKQTYTLLDYYGKPWTGTGAGTYSDYRVDQPYGIFGVDRLDGDRNARAKLLGSIAYVRGTDRFHPSQLIFVTKLDSIEIANTTAYIEPGTQTNKRPVALYNLQTSTGVNLIARNLTSIGGASSYFGSDWKTSGVAEGGLLSSVVNAFTATTSGANLCYRYQNGVLTTQPLWPWPMNQRIKDATVQSGRAAVDVTATIASLLGPIPAACGSTNSNGGTTPTPTPTPTAPTAPANLQVSP